MSWHPTGCPPAPPEGVRQATDDSREVEAGRGGEIQIPGRAFGQPVCADRVPAGEHQTEVSSGCERNPGKLAVQVFRDSDQAAASSGS
jgi:hypothetical protein